MSVGLHIELEEIDQKIILRIEGRLDAMASPVLERKIGALIDENRLSLLLDFTRVSYLSSAGMRVLLSASKKLKAKKGSMVLFSLQEEVEEILKMAGFDKILHICPSEKEALHFHHK
jgi:anti-sigma B factor antagonist/stage II sporulation protein AA (anti-sigma F factor antagonist)